MKNNKAILIFLALLPLVIIIGAGYLWQKQKTEVGTKTVETQEEKPQTEENLVDNIYINKPKDWGNKKVEEKVKGAYTEEEIEAAGYGASCDLTRIKFEKFARTEEEINSDFDSIFVAKMADFQRFYEVSTAEPPEKKDLYGPNRLQEIYNKRNVEKDALFDDIDIKTIDQYMFLRLPGAVPVGRRYGYIESNNGSFRGFWSIATFIQSPTSPDLSCGDPYFVSVMTDGENVVQFYFPIKSAEVENFKERRDKIMIDYPKTEKELRELCTEYDKFLKENTEINSQVEQLISVVKSLHKK